MADKLNEIGAATLLTGVGPEGTVGAQQLFVADLFRKGRWLAALRQSQRWALAKNSTLWSVFYRSALRPNLPAALHDGWGTLLRGGYGRWPKVGRGDIPGWIEPAFASKYRLRKRGLNAVRSLYRFPFQRNFDAMAQRLSAGEWGAWYLTGPAGIRTRKPFLDPRVIRFCLALPTALREVPTMSKPVFQSAMKGILPEEIRTRACKRHFNDVNWGGLAKNLPALEAMIRNSSIADLGIFQNDVLIDCLRQHAMGIGHAGVGARLACSLSVIAWFDQLKTKSVPVEPAGTYLISGGHCHAIGRRGRYPTCSGHEELIPCA
jgi:asparagine synthase (glutamine-hydrolysing)